LQKFVTVNAYVQSYFNQKRSLSSRDTFRLSRNTALSEWRGLCAE